MGCNYIQRVLLQLNPSFRMCSYIEEVLGHPAMASMGRMRRRMATASLLQLICNQISPVLLELISVAQWRRFLGHSG